MSAPEGHIHWREPHRVTTYDVDFANRLRLSTVFSLMQDAASNNADHLGWGYDALKKDSLFWVLSRAKILIHRHPVLGDDLTVDTWPKRVEGIFAVRDFRIHGPQGDVLCAATTCWLMLDERSMRPVKPAELLRRYPFNDASSAIDEVPGKLAEPGVKTPAYEKQVRYMDIDVNLHVNNVSHIASILDCFPLEQFRQRRIASMQVNYTGELKHGDVLRLFSADASPDGELSYVDGENQGGKKIFQSLIEWKQHLSVTIT